MTQNFLQSIIDFLAVFQFDGIEIDWDSPSRGELKTLLRGIYKPLSSRGYYVLVALRPEVQVDEEIEKLSDLLLLKAWRRDERSTTIAQQPAPINYVMQSVKQWINNGVQAKNVVLGIPLFGKSYTLRYSNNTDTGAPAKGVGVEGTYTRRKGTLAYFEVN